MRFAREWARGGSVTAVLMHEHEACPAMIFHRLAAASRSDPITGAWLGIDLSPRVIAVAMDVPVESDTAELLLIMSMAAAAEKAGD